MLTEDSSECLIYEKASQTPCAYVIWEQFLHDEVKESQACDVAYVSIFQKQMRRFCPRYRSDLIIKVSCRLSCGLHLRILAALCNDVSDCTTLRNEISARVEEMNQLQTQFRLRQVEVKSPRNFFCKNNTGLLQLAMVEGSGI